MNEKDLYYACSRYCDVFTHYLTTKFELQESWTSEDEKKRIMNFEKEHLKDAIDDLNDKLSEICSYDLKDKYKQLELENKKLKQEIMRLESITRTGKESK